MKLVAFVSRSRTLCVYAYTVKKFANVYFSNEITSEHGAKFPLH